MRKVLTVLAVVIVLGMIAVGALTWLGGQRGAPGGPGTADPSAEGALNVAPAPEQPDWCPAVQVMAAPGTWESNPQDDPLNPQHQPSYLSMVTQPLSQAYAPTDVRVWTLPYSAQFRNITNMNQLSFDESRAEGQQKFNAELAFMNSTCPGTEFILFGFSQGAGIVGDVANEIGTGVGAVPVEKVRGVALIADPRREPGVGVTAGADVPGVGVEIAMQPVNSAIQFVVPNASMRGPRPGGFGSLSDRVYQVCAVGDLVCDAPRDIGNSLDRAHQLITGNPVHAQYGFNQSIFDGPTANEWLLQWTHDHINAP
ncbi:cutinase family protein [Corynebacterium uterequi]|uniref:Cutinase n=1 Tax=Corynebacterium uterequi TaxID=1072256 RepID=A0A0G3HGY8_9CORY|nr:cutinase family protein [Corynebacterium uterequi]AKK12045.1 Cutinase [Corynebacterium uterequi]